MSDQVVLSDIWTGAVVYTGVTVCKWIEVGGIDGARRDGVSSNDYQILVDWCRVLVGVKSVGT
jgi:hypothetical protein